MRLVLSSESFKKSVSAAQSLISESQILLTANSKDGTLTIEAGHSGVYLKQVISAQVHENGSIVLNGSYVSSLRISGPVELSTGKDNKLYFKTNKLSGTVESHQDSGKITSQRPDDLIENQVSLSKDTISRGVSKTNFSAIMAATQEGLRVRITDKLTVSTTDQWRLSLFKSSLPPIAKKELDFLIKPEILAAVIHKIEEPEVGFGIKDGIIKIASPSFEFYHPTIQTEPTDIEGWLNELDPNDRIGHIKTNAEELYDLIAGVGSINQIKTEDPKISCTIKNGKLQVKVETVQGSAKGEMELEGSSVDNYQLTLNCKQTLEMLALIKEGELTVHIYDAYIILFSGDEQCVSVVPTVTL
jgi:DNA polymerase III sliding clamp (beta) subunit (PCNA family)